MLVSFCSPLPTSSEIRSLLNSKFHCFLVQVRKAKEAVFFLCQTLFHFLPHLNKAVYEGRIETSQRPGKPWGKDVSAPYSTSTIFIGKGKSEKEENDLNDAGG